MRSAAMAKLKTYTAEIDGLHDWIVAAPNQRAALDAFGVNQDLFAQGEAHATTDADRVKAAAAQPGAPLRRMKGGEGAWEPVAGATDWTSALDASRAKAPKKKPPSRRALDEAEAALKDFDAERQGEIAELEKQLAAMTKRLDQARASYGQRRGELQAAVDRAEKAYQAKVG
jgi:hypothetical protein